MPSTHKGNKRGRSFISDTMSVRINGTNGTAGLVFRSKIKGRNMDPTGSIFVICNLSTMPTSLHLGDT